MPIVILPPRCKIYLDLIVIYFVSILNKKMGLKKYINADKYISKGSCLQYFDVLNSQLIFSCLSG